MPAPAQTNAPSATPPPTADTPGPSAPPGSPASPAAGGGGASGAGGGSPDPNAGSLAPQLEAPATDSGNDRGTADSTTQPVQARSPLAGARRPV
jgi:hypothetical protein